MYPQSWWHHGWIYTLGKQHSGSHQKWKPHSQRFFCDQKTGSLCYWDSILYEGQGCAVWVLGLPSLSRRKTSVFRYASHCALIYMTQPHLGAASPKGLGRGGVWHWSADWAGQGAGYGPPKALRWGDPGTRTQTGGHSYVPSCILPRRLFVCCQARFSLTWGQLLLEVPVLMSRYWAGGARRFLARTYHPFLNWRTAVSLWTLGTARGFLTSPSWFLLETEQEFSISFSHLFAWSVFSAFLVARW